MRQVVIESITCLKCDHKRYAPIDISGRPKFINRHDAYCPECGMEAELPDDIKLQKLLKAS